MAVRMKSVGILPDNKDNQNRSIRKSYTYKQTVSSAGNGDWIFIPNGVRMISVILEATGSGRVEATNDFDAVDAGTTADCVTIWENGVISSTTQSAMLAPVVAVRAVSTSGEVKLAVMAAE